MSSPRHTTRTIVSSRCVSFLASRTADRQKLAHNVCFFGNSSQHKGIPRCMASRSAQRPVPIHSPTALASNNGLGRPLCFCFDPLAKTRRSMPTDAACFCFAGQRYPAFFVLTISTCANARITLSLGDVDTDGQTRSCCAIHPAPFLDSPARSPEMFGLGRHRIVPAPRQLSASSTNGLQISEGGCRSTARFQFLEILRTQDAK